MATEKEMKLVLAIREALREKFGDRVIPAGLRWNEVDNGSTNTLVFLRAKDEKKGWDSACVTVELGEPHWSSKEAKSVQVRYAVRSKNKTTRYPITDGKINLTAMVERVGVGLAALEAEEKRDQARYEAAKEASARNAAMEAELKRDGMETARFAYKLERRSRADEMYGLYSGAITFKCLTLKEIRELEARIRGFEDSRPD